MATETQTPADETAEVDEPLVRVPPLNEPAEAHPAAVLVGVLLLIVVSVLAAVRLTPPEVRPADAPAEAFSGARAVAALKRVLGERPEPHPFGSRANDRVRRRLIAELTSLGYAPTLQETFWNSTKHGNCGAVKNVLARLEGTDPEGKLTLLVAHYDSVASGPGVSDDGAGVATLLEVARALKQGPPPAQPVVFLFTDGEEAGLLGAEAFVAEHPWAERIGCLINVEARGSRGPSLMFQTGPKNAELVRRFGRAALRPITGSSFTTVYENLPNDTDFSPFKELPEPPPGINLAYIGGVQQYHTNQDDFEHLDPRSIQHHGDSALGLARSLAAEPLGPSAGDAVFFDVFGWAIVQWDASLTPALAGLALLLVIVAALLPARGGRTAVVARSFGIGLALFVLAFAASCGVVYLLATQLVRADQTPWPAEPGATVLCLGAAALTLQALLAGVFGGRSGYWGAWGATWVAWAGAALGLAFTPFVGFSFLFLVPALAAGLGGVLAGTLGRCCRVSAAAAGVLPLLLAGCVWLPTLLLMYDALGVHPRSPTLYCWALFLTAALPLLALRSRTRHSSALLFAAISLVLIAGLGSVRSQRYAVDPVRAAGDPPHTDRPYQLDAPRVATFAYVQEVGEAPAANWLVFGAGRALPEFLRSAPQRFSDRQERPYPWLRRSSWVAKGAPRTGAKAPAFAEVTSTAQGSGRMVQGVLRSARGARQVALVLPPETPLAKVRIGGKPATVASPKARAWRTQGYHVFWCFTVPEEGVKVELELTSTAKVQGTVLDAHQGLPPNGALLEELREPLGTPWGLWADLWVHTAKVEF